MHRSYIHVHTNIHTKYRQLYNAHICLCYCQPPLFNISPRSLHTYIHKYRWETASSLTCTISWSSIAFELSRSTTQSSRNYCPPSYYQQQYVNFYTYINTSYIHTYIHTSSNIQNIVRTCVHTVRSTTYYTYYIHICITYVHTYILC